MSGLDIDALAVRELARSGHPLWLIHAGDAATFRARHLPGAVHFDAPAQAVAILQPTDHVVVYDVAADRPVARLLACRLRDLGYLDAYHLAGGLEAWQRAGGHIEGVGDRGS